MPAKSFLRTKKVVLHSYIWAGETTRKNLNKEVQRLARPPQDYCHVTERDMY